MKIYVGHSRNFDYIHELYEPILDSTLSKEYEIIFPHYENKEVDSQEIIKNSDLLIAEVSYPSLGLGIEIGRAEIIGKKILCLYRKGIKCPSSLKFVNTDIIEYKDNNNLIEKIQQYLKEIK